MFQHQARAELRKAIVDSYYTAIRMALVTFEVANSICHVISAALLLGLAYYLATGPAQQAPLWNVVAFMAGWWGIALGCEGLDQLESRDQRLDPLFEDSHDFTNASSVPVRCCSCRYEPVIPPPHDDAWLEELLRLPPPAPRVPN
ncbi:hypothetical protein ACWAT4_37025 [Bradyrhizobium manausense]